MYRHDSLDFPFSTREKADISLESCAMPFLDEGHVRPRFIPLASQPVLAAVLNASDDQETATRFRVAMAGEDLNEKLSAIATLITMADDSAALALLISVLDEAPLHAAAIAAVRARTGMTPPSEVLSKNPISPLNDQTAYPVADTTLAWSTWLQAKATALPAIKSEISQKNPDSRVSAE
jgi:hypothetical protein